MMSSCSMDFQSDQGGEWLNAVLNKLTKLLSIKNSLLVSWVKRMIDGKSEAWMAIPSYYLENVGGTFIFECNYDVDLLNLNGLPEFYVDTLKACTVVRNQRRIYTRKSFTNSR